MVTQSGHLMTEPLLHQSETPMTPLDTVTRGFNPHAVLTMETPTEDQSQPTPPSPQLMTPTIPLLTPPDRTQPTPIPKPANWMQMSKTQQRNWLKHHLPR